MKKHVIDIFDKYTNTSCYWAGILATDGCIDVNNTVRLELNSKDLKSIQDFKLDTEAAHEISYRESTDAYSIRFCDVSICESLKENFSVTVGKTLNLEFPILPENMYPHYIRGIFDGDGCLTEFFANRPTASFRVYITSASLQFLQDLQQYLLNSGIIVGGSIQKKAARCWHLQLAIKDSTCFLNYIYLNNNVKDLRYMERKYLKYKKIIIDNNRDKIKV